jgi:alpha-galactosidase
LTPEDREIADLLATEINLGLQEAENKVWHAHPVWFVDGNPVVGYSKLKGKVRLLFWSGQSFVEKDLKPEGSFKAAEARFTTAD